MTKCKRLARVGGILFLLCGCIWAGAIDQLISYGKSCLDQDRMEEQKQFIVNHIPALGGIDKFELFDDTDLQAAINANLPREIEIPIRRPSPTQLDTRKVFLERKNIHAKDFRFWMHPELTSEREGVPSETYRGYVVGGKSSSLAVLYIPQKNIGGGERQGFISGFIMDQTGWYFIEPVRSLLKLQKLQPGDPTDWEAALHQKGLYPECRPHIVYQPKNTAFRLALGSSQPVTDRFSINLDFPTRIQRGISVPIKATLTNNGSAINNAVLKLQLTPLPQGTPASRTITNVNLGIGQTIDIELLSPYPFNSIGRYGVEVTLSNVEGSCPNPECIVAREAQGIITKDPVTLEEVLDRNNDNWLNQPELLTALRRWIDSKEVYGYGKIIEDDQMVKLIGIWAGEQPLRDNSKTLPRTLSLTVVGDPDFYNLSNDPDASNNEDFNKDSEKRWWQRQEEVLNLVDSLFSMQGSGFPGMDIQINALEIWKSKWPNYPNDDITALRLLCNFVEPLSKPSEPKHANLIHTDADIVHLMTGIALAPMSKDDGGDDICPEPRCGDRADRYVVGLAENIGGFRGDTLQKCDAARFLTTHSKIIPGPVYIPPARHSLSQHKPTPQGNGANNSELFSKTDPCGTEGKIEDKNRRICETWNYNALLYQRFILVAHELGHNLNAKHTQEKDSQDSGQDHDNDRACNPFGSCSLTEWGHTMMLPGLNHNIVFRFFDTQHPETRPEDSPDNNWRIKDCASTLTCPAP